MPTDAFKSVLENESKEMADASNLYIMYEGWLEVNAKNDNATSQSFNESTFFQFNVSKSKPVAFVHISNRQDRRMGDLCVAFPTGGDVLTTKLVGDFRDERSLRAAAILARKTEFQVYVYTNWVDEPFCDNSSTFIQLILQIGKAFNEKLWPLIVSNRLLVSNETETKILRTSIDQTVNFAAVPNANIEKMIQAIEQDIRSNETKSIESIQRAMFNLQSCQKLFTKLELDQSSEKAQQIQISIAKATIQAWSKLNEIREARNKDLNSTRINPQFKASASEESMETQRENLLRSIKRNDQEDIQQMDQNIQEDISESLLALSKSLKHSSNRFANRLSEDLLVWIFLAR